MVTRHESRDEMNRDVMRTARAIAFGGAGLLAIVLAVYLFWQLRTIAGVVFLGVIVGIALTPLADYLARYHIPRVLSVLLVYGVVGGLLGLFVWYAVVEFAGEFDELSAQIDDFRAQYEDFAREQGLPDAEEAGTIIQDNGSGYIDNVVGQAFSLIGALFYVVMIFFVGLLFSISKERLRDALFAVLDDDQQEWTASILDTLAHKLRRFLLAEFISMLVVGVITYVGLLLIGIRFPIVLATLAFLFELIPTVGPWLAYAPALAVALTDGIVPAIQVSILYFVIQQIESYVVIPVVHGQNIPALLIIIALLVGAALMGILGALIALPLAIIVHTFYFEVVVPWRQRQIADARRQRLRMPRAIEG